MRCKWETIMERTQRWGVREAEDLILLLWPRGTLPPFNFEREEHFHPLSKHLFGDGVLPEPLCSVEKTVHLCSLFSLWFEANRDVPTAHFLPLLATLQSAGSAVM